MRLEKERLLTEEEITRLNDVAVNTSAAPPTTTAPANAPLASVQDGMRSAQEVETADIRGTNRSKYAEGGSLAQYEREKAQEKKAGKP